MKKALSIAGQTVLLIVAAFVGFIVGAAVPALRLSHEVSRTATNIRTYDLAWVVAVWIVYLLLLLVGVVRKRIQASWLPSTVALMLAFAFLLIFTQIGVRNTSLYF